MPYRHLFFDLDGTLTDSKEGIINAFAYALNFFGKPYRREELSYIVGPPLQGCFADFGITGPDFMTALRKFQEYFGEKGIWQNRVFDDIPAVLAGLRQGGANLYLVTSKPLPYARQILDGFHLSSCFTAITGGDMDENTVEKEELLSDLLKRLSLADAPRTDMAMIGDRLFDIRGAKANGMTACGVLWGIGSREELAGADMLFREPKELLMLVK